jgi:hypothetical protein
VSTAGWQPRRAPSGSALWAILGPRSQQSPRDATNKNPYCKWCEDVELVGETPIRKREGRVTYNSYAPFPTRHATGFVTPSREEKQVSADKSNHSKNHRGQLAVSTVHSGYRLLIVPTAEVPIYAGIMCGCVWVLRL